MPRRAKSSEQKCVRPYRLWERDWTENKEKELWLSFAHCNQQQQQQQRQRRHPTRLIFLHLSCRRQRSCKGCHEGGGVMLKLQRLEIRNRGGVPDLNCNCTLAMRSAHSNFYQLFLISIFVCLDFHDFFLSTNRIATVKWRIIVATCFKNERLTALD